MKQYNKPTKS